MDTGKTIARAIADSRFFDRFGYKKTWISGSSTVDVPITHGVTNKEIVVQLSLKKYRGRTQAISALIKTLKGKAKAISWHFEKKDGNCPPKLTVRYE